MAQSHHHGERSPQINAYLAASACNFEKLIIWLKVDLCRLIFVDFWILFSGVHRWHAPRLKLK